MNHRKRQAVPSMSDDEKRAAAAQEFVPAESLSPLTSPVGLRQQPLSGFLHDTYGSVPLREVSGKAARKKRATGNNSSPDSSVRTTPSEVDQTFVPRAKAPNKPLYNPNTSSSLSRQLQSRNPTTSPPQQKHHRPSHTPVAQVHSPTIGSTDQRIQQPSGHRGIFPASALIHPVTSSSHRNISLAQPAVLPSPSRPYRTVDEDARNDETLEDPRLILQPVTRPISQEQLIAEVKGIYAGLVMVEGKCIQVDAKQTQLVKDAPVGQPPKLNNEQYQALIALHRTLLHEHHDFFLASQHPSATPGVRRLALKYAMPARLWKHGIHAFLELLRNRLPDSIEHMLAFIYLAYSMMTLLLETVPAFESTWIECLGDLARYRMAIVEKDPDDEYDSDVEDEADESDAEKLAAMKSRNELVQWRIESLSTMDAKIRKTRKKRRAYNDQERETWTQVAFEWYVKASNSSPEVGRLYHHLAILSQSDEAQQFFYYGKALVVPKPFEAARESVLTLFRPVFGQRRWRRGAVKVDKSFTTMHAVMFTRNEMYRFEEELSTFSRKIDGYIIDKKEVFLESIGHHMAIGNINALTDHGKASNPIVKALLDTSSPASDVEMVDAATTHTDAQVFEMALRLYIQTTQTVFGRSNDKNVLSFVHCTLVFMHRLSLSPTAMDILEASFPWQALATMLNTLLQSYSDHDRILGRSIPLPPIADARPLREDFALREIFWTNRYYPQCWFNDKHMDREDQFRDNAFLVDSYRPERVLWLGAQLAKRVGSLCYDSVDYRFTASTRHIVVSRPEFDYSNEQESVTLAGDVDDVSMVSLASA